MFLLAGNLADIFFRFAARQHHFMAASQASDFKIHADPQDQEPVFPAGMLFFHCQHIAYLDIQRAHLTFFIRVKQYTRFYVRMPILFSDYFARAAKNNKDFSAGKMRRPPFVRTNRQADFQPFSGVGGFGLPSCKTVISFRPVSYIFSREVPLWTENARRMFCTSRAEWRKKWNDICRKAVYGILPKTPLL